MPAVKIAGKQMHGCAQIVSTWYQCLTIEEIVFNYMRIRAIIAQYLFYEITE